MMQQSTLQRGKRLILSKSSEQRDISILTNTSLALMLGLLITPVTDRCNLYHLHTCNEQGTFKPPMSCQCLSHKIRYLETMPFPDSQLVSKNGLDALKFSQPFISIILFQQLF